jgi:hypothetical protein
MKQKARPRSPDKPFPVFRTNATRSPLMINIGASEGIRTLDTHVGNVMLYQAELRSLPEAIKL